MLVSIQDELEIALQVVTAQGVITLGIFEIAGPAVMHQHRPGRFVTFLFLATSASVARDDVDVLHRFLPALGVHQHQSEIAGRVGVYPMIFPVDSNGGLIDMHHRHLYQLFNRYLFPFFQCLTDSHDPLNQGGFGDQSAGH